MFDSGGFPAPSDVQHAAIASRTFSSSSATESPWEYSPASRHLGPEATFRLFVNHTVYVVTSTFLHGSGSTGSSYVHRRYRPDGQLQVRGSHAAHAPLTPTQAPDPRTLEEMPAYRSRTTTHAGTWPGHAASGAQPE